MNKLLPLFTFTFILRLTALAVSHNWHYQKDLIDHGNAYVLTQWKLVDKGWRPRVRPGGHWDGEFVPFNEHFDKWVIVSTNKAVRPLSVPAHSIYRDNLTNLTAQVANLTPDAQLSRKARHAAENAEKHDKKNFEKLIEDIEKARDKSSAELAEFFQAILDQAAAAREE